MRGPRSKVSRAAGARSVRRAAPVAPTPTTRESIVSAPYTHCPEHGNEIVRGRCAACDCPYDAEDVAP